MALTLVFGPSTPILGLYDVRTFGAKCDLKGVSATMAAGSPNVTAGANWKTTDAGKLVTIRGAGAVVATRTDGSMTTAVSYNSNVLTSAGASFTKALRGKRITVTGVGVAGATINTFVWDVISATQLRLGANAVTIASSQTYVISDDLYASVISATDATSAFTSDGTAVLSASAGTAVALAVGSCSSDDAPYVAAAVAAAFADAPRDLQASAPTIFIPYSIGIGSPIELTNFAASQRVGRLRMVGAGMQGYSELLARGSVTIRAMQPNLNAFIRWAPPTSGMGLRGSIASGTAILTDPDAPFSAGMAGKAISIIGAGTQLGSMTRTALNATILTYDSPTQVTISTNALTTVVEGVYSWADNSWAHGGFDSFSLERLHLMGASGHKCGVHSIAANTYEMKNVTISDFRSGVAHYSDGMVNGSTMMNIQDCMLNDSYIGALAAGNPGGTLVFTGRTYIDGNSNAVGVMPGEGTIGIDCNSLYAQGSVVIQGYYTPLYADFSANALALRLEGFQKGLVLNGDGISTDSRHDVRVTSWSTTNVAGSLGRGIILGAGVRKAKLWPGFYVPGNIGMYTDSDATALQSSFTDDVNIHGAQTPTFAASYTPDLALGKTIAMTLTGNITALNAPVRATAGIVLRFIFLQDGVGGRTVGGWDPIYKVLNWTPNTAAGKRNTIDFSPDGTNWVQIGSTVQT